MLKYGPKMIHFLTLAEKRHFNALAYEVAVGVHSMKNVRAKDPILEDCSNMNFSPTTLASLDTRSRTYEKVSG
jgi:hypothetical protein